MEAEELGVRGGGRGMLGTIKCEIGLGRTSRVGRIRGIISLNTSNNSLRNVPEAIAITSTTMRLWVLLSFGKLGQMNRHTGK